MGTLALRADERVASVETTDDLLSVALIVARGRGLCQFRGVAGHPCPQTTSWNLLRPYGFQERSMPGRRQPLAAKVAGS